jgi:hypothetical protein
MFAKKKPAPPPPASLDDFSRAIFKLVGEHQHLHPIEIAHRLEAAATAVLGQYAVTSKIL